VPGWNVHGGDEEEEEEEEDELDNSHMHTTDHPNPLPPLPLPSSNSNSSSRRSRTPTTSPHENPPQPVSLLASARSISTSRSVILCDTDKQASFQLTHLTFLTVVWSPPLILSHNRFLQSLLLLATAADAGMHFSVDHVGFGFDSFLFSYLRSLSHHPLPQHPRTLVTLLPPNTSEYHFMMPSKFFQFLIQFFFHQHVAS
jgi:hypothetical protein